MSEPQPEGPAKVGGVDYPRDPRPVGRAVRLPNLQRWLAGVFGTGLGAAGVWAVIIAGKDGAGSVALVVAALALWLIALIGHIPYKLWGKDIGYEMGELDSTKKLAQIVADEVSPETMQNIVDAVVAAPPASAPFEWRSFEIAVASQLSSASQDVREFEMSCDRALGEALVEIAEDVSDVEVDDMDQRGFADRMIRTPSGHIYVEYKTRVSSDTIKRMQAMLEARASNSDGLLIIGRNVSVVAQLMSKEYPRLRVAEYSKGVKQIVADLRDLISFMSLID